MSTLDLIQLFPIKVTSTRNIDAIGGTEQPGDSELGPTSSSSRFTELYMDASSLTLSKRGKNLLEKHKSKYITRRTSKKQVQESKIGINLLGS
jgi:hypothetical protein